MSTPVSEAGVTSPGAGLGGRYGNPGVPSRQDPPLDVAGRIRRKGRADTVGASAAAGVAGRFHIVPPAAYGAPLRIFCQGLLP